MTTNRSSSLKLALVFICVNALSTPARTDWSAGSSQFFHPDSARRALLDAFKGHDGSERYAVSTYDNTIKSTDNK